MTDIFMPPAPLQTAVLFLVFNRPDTTTQVFQAIRQAKPPRLYVAADGPRADREGEAEKVARVREIATAVDWPCELKTLFRDENLGCKYAPIGGITWFFEHEQQGIILEDDCLPSQSFFWFCEELLDRYSDAEQVMMISGYNKQQRWMADSCDYFFSNLGGIWGWASWRRAWRHYDVNMEDLDEMLRDGTFEHLLGTKLGRLRSRQLNAAKIAIASGKINAWDYQWGYTRHKLKGISCVPSRSLIANIGFGVTATHTKQSVQDPVIQEQLSLPTRINPCILPDRSYDEMFLCSARQPFLSRLKSIATKLLT